MPLAPPVIKIVLLVSFIIKYLLSYVRIWLGPLQASPCGPAGSVRLASHKL
jgi:hypothetical protein